MPINPSLLLKQKKQASEYTFTRRMHEYQHNVIPKYHVYAGGKRLTDTPVSMKHISEAGMLTKRGLKFVEVS